MSHSGSHMVQSLRMLDALEREISLETTVTVVDMDSWDAHGVCVLKAEPSLSLSQESTRATYHDIDDLAASCQMTESQRKACNAKAFKDLRAKVERLEAELLVLDAPQNQFDCTCPANDDDNDIVVRDD